MNASIAASKTASRWRLPVAVALMLLAGFGVVTLLNIGKAFHYLDLQVYRAGGLTWLAGLGLYDASFPRPFPLDYPLPFTYPPIAAVLFSVIGLPSFWVSAVLFTLLSLAALFATGALVASRMGFGRQQAWWVGSAIGFVAIGLEPVRETLMFGQINLILMVMIAADCLMKKTPWPRGLMIGIAAAIKLTPLAFLLFFLVRWQWRPMITAVVSFVGAGALGFLLSPGNSVQYWLHTLVDSGRIGSPIYATNQSIRGVLTRLGIDSNLLWVTVVLAVTALAALAVYQLRTHGADVLALLLVAVTGLLASPVSWSHHWVWIAPALLWLSVLIWQQRKHKPIRLKLTAIGFVLLAVFVIGGHHLVPKGNDRELTWDWGAHILGNSYALIALAIVMASVGYVWRGRVINETTTPPEQAGMS